MCGIVGIYGFEDRRLLDRMSKMIVHRGPDDSGHFQDKNIILGHRRLSIIDLSEKGRQPIHNEDDSIWITYNGELYNFKELKKELESKGHRFYSQTDTEVIVHAYEEYGEGCVNRFNGMFAFAIWDSNKKQLFLARDRYGIKPLYYTFIDNKFLFASEVKAILQYKDVKREVNIDALHSFINMRFIYGKDTLFKGIQNLLPGNYMILNKKGIMAYKKFYFSDIKPEKNSEAYFLKKLEKILLEAVERHMISDVPVGVYLSGGMDSTTLLSIASKFSNKPLRTYTMGFGEENDELEQARKIADFYETDHKETIIRSNLLYDFPKMIWHMDTPKRNLWPFYLSELASKYNKVMLSGIGGDEFLGGYDYRYYNFLKIEDMKNSLDAKSQSNIIHYAKKLIDIHLRTNGLDRIQNVEYLESLYFMKDKPSLYLLYNSIDRCYDKYTLKKIYGNKFSLQNLPNLREMYGIHFKNNKLELFDQIMLSDINFKLSYDFLPIGDALSMAHSVEDRFPFLDYEYADFAMNVPWDIKFKNLQGKYILRKLMKDKLPKEILVKKKQGFAPDAYNIYKRELKEISQSILPNGELIKEGYFKKNYILDILKRKPDPSFLTHYNLIWKLAGFEIWHRIYITGEAKEPKNMEKFLC